MARKPKKLSEMKEEHLQCRMLTHAWNPLYTEEVVVDRKRANAMHVECLRCEGMKVILFFHNHDRKSRGIKYPESYLVDDLKSWGGRRQLNANVVDELMRRMTTPKKRKLRAVG